MAQGSGWTPSAALRELTRAQVLPPGGDLDARRGTYSWHERGLRLQLLLAKAGPPRRDRCQAFIGAQGTLGDPLDQGGFDATVPLRAVDASGGRYDTLDTVVDFATQARMFVADPIDLCWLLSREEEVTRGALRTWLYQAYPFRLVKALALATDLGAHDLGREIVAVLHSGRRVPVSPTADADVLVEARARAKELGRTTGRTVEI